jgi:hypothetical protein
MQVNGQLHVPAALLPGTNWTGGWVGPRGGLDTGDEKNLALLGIEPPPAASRDLETKRDQEGI